MFFVRFFYFILTQRKFGCKTSELWQMSMDNFSSPTLLLSKKEAHEFARFVAHWAARRDCVFLGPQALF